MEYITLNSKAVTEMDIVKEDLKEVKKSLTNQDSRLTAVEKELAELKALLKKQK